MSCEALKLLGLAKRASLLAVGEDMVEEAVAAHKARLILLASDTAAGTVRRTRTLAGDRIPVMVLENSTKSQLGGALGRETCALCAVCDMGLAAKVAEKLAAETPELAPIAAELAAKQDKMVLRKKKKPRKKK
jgi:ribosomal protein L7Ae-like RNA K-turn-binding protein